MKEEIRRLQNHFNAGKKEGYQAKVYYSVNDRKEAFVKNGIMDID